MYHVEFTSTAADDLERLSKPTAQRIFSKIRWLADNFDSLTPEPLTGQWKGVYKLRAGDYRVLYTFSAAESRITSILSAIAARFTNLTNAGGA